MPNRCSSASICFDARRISFEMAMSSIGGTHLPIEAYARIALTISYGWLWQPAGM
jgi:hypothetical protein